MIIPKYSKRAIASRGFTLTELMVVIVIVAVLAAISLSVSDIAKKSAEKATCMSRLRQVGVILTGKAMERNSKVEVFTGGGGLFDYRPYFILRDELDLPKNPKEAHYQILKEIMFCPSAPDPGNVHWNCFGVHVGDSDVAGSRWVRDKVEDDSGRKGTVSTLRLASVRHPSRCVLVADSCHASGREIFRIRGGDLLGLRHKGKANVLFLDGSAGSFGKSELGQLGFKKAYDTSSTPPKLVSLPK